MKALARLEGFIQDLVERPAWLLTQRRLHPIEIAAALTRAMESDALPLADRVLAPDGYAVRLNPGDFANFVDVRRTLEREYADYLARLAEERGLTLNAPAAVAIVKAAEVRPGTVEVAARFTEADEPHRRRTVARPLGVPDLPPLTEVVPRPAEPRRVAGAVVELIGQDGRVKLRQQLDGNGLVIGRRTSSGLTLDDPEVSRRHARIDYRAPDYVVSDLGSMNGTAVNGRMITGPHPLADGDLINVGHARLRFRRGG